MHHRKFIYLLNLVIIYSIFIVCPSLVNYVEASSTRKTNVHRNKRNSSNLQRIQRNRNRKFQGELRSKNETLPYDKSKNYARIEDQGVFVSQRMNAPTFKGNYYVRRNEVDNIQSFVKEKSDKAYRFNQADYYTFLGGRYNLMNFLWDDNIGIFNPEERLNDFTEYKWLNDKYLGSNIDSDYDMDQHQKIYYLLNQGVSVSVPNSASNNNKDFEEYVSTHLGKSNATELFYESPLRQYKSDHSLKYSGFRNNCNGIGNKVFQNKVNNEIQLVNITLSISDPVDLIQEKDSLLINMNWNQDVLSEVPSKIPEKIVNFEYQHGNEQESGELDGKEGTLLKEFVRTAVDFSFLSGSSLNGAVCMFKAVLPLMKIRWKSIKSINISRMDTIVKIMLGIPFFRYFEEKENMISSCINMFFSMDMDSGEGLCLNKSGFESSIMGISIADFKIHQYYDNKHKLMKDKGSKKESNEFRPHDSANLLEMIYDDVCNYFYECMDEDISDEVNDYILQNANIFGIMENQRINFFKENQTPLFPDTSERKSSIDALPSDWFLAALQHLSQMNAELPELSFPGLNIRDLGRLYFYSGRLGVQLPIRLTLKMIYELSAFANHSSLLRKAFCTETLLSITNFKIANVLCEISFSTIPLKFNPKKLYTSLKDLLKMISFAPKSWKKRPNPICSEAEVVSEKYPNVIYSPDFIQYFSVRDKWSLYRSLSIQLYGNLVLEGEELTSSIVSMIHSLVIGYIKLNWDEFKKYYLKVGIIDPEKYYSLLVSQRRGPALIELIALSRVYNIKIKLYKKVLRNSKREIRFELDEEITKVVEQLSDADYHFDEGNSKTLTCKVLRLLVDREQSPGSYQGVFKKNVSNFNQETQEKVNDGSSWVWDAILPVYDAKTNEKILSNEIGVKIEYKTILKEHIDSEYEFLNGQDGKNVSFPPFEVFRDEVKNSELNQMSWRKPSNYTFGQIFVSNPKASINSFEEFNKQNNPNIIGKVNNTSLQLENGLRSFPEKYYKFSIVVQPLISFYKAGVYEGKVFMNKVFKNNPYFNLRDLRDRLDLEYLQNVIYVGDVYKEKKNQEIENWKPREQKENTTSILPDNILNTEADKEDSEVLDQIGINSNITLTRNDSETSIDEMMVTNFTPLENNKNFYFESGDEIIKMRKPEKQFEYLSQNQGNSPSEFGFELDYKIIPILKPWNDFVNLPKAGVLNSEPEFSFIPLKSGSILPNKVQQSNNKFKLEMETLFNLARDHWMLPLYTVSRALYCFGKNIASFLNNPNPSYIPQMLIYDRIISTVVSLLPVVDNTMNNLRPMEFIITVCEMALLDPIDLDPFLVIGKSVHSSGGVSRHFPNDLMRIFGQMPAIKNICSLVANCIHSPNYGNEYNNLISKHSKSEEFNQYTPSSEQVILIQKLVPRFPEVVVIIKNLLRMIHFIGRKGVLLEKDALCQIAKELAIAFHSISPYIWKREISLNRLYEMANNPAGSLRQARREERNNSFVPVYDEAYWGHFDKELLVYTCASILTSRSALTLTMAMVVCHYSFLRIPLSKSISSTIPDSKDLETDEKMATEALFFFLRDFTKDPIELIKSKEYNEDPMGMFNKVYSKWQDKQIIKIGLDKEIIKRKIFSSDYNSLMFITYDKYIDLLLENRQELEYNEIKFEKTITNKEMDSFSRFEYNNNFKRGNFYNIPSGRNGFLREKTRFDENFSNFWKFIPSPFKVDLRKSQTGSNTEDIFESLSLLLYATNNYKDLIKTTFTSTISIINQVCELEREIMKRSKKSNAFIHVEGADQEVVLFVLSICNNMKDSREKMKQKKECTSKAENCKLENIDNKHEMQHLEVFEVLQFIYKIPIMVFETDQEQTTIRDTELNRRIYSLNDTNVLASSIRLAKVFDDSSKESFRYMPMIPQVTVDDFEKLKNGVGPIPLEAILNAMKYVPRSKKDRESFKFRKRTAFDDASDNFLNRKQAPLLFPDGNYSRNSKYYPELVPILRRYIPYIPGDVEGKSLLHFIKISTAIIDLRRRPIKELPDIEMEKTFRSILLDGKNLGGSREYLMKIYGLNVDELIEKNTLFEEKLINQYDENGYNMLSNLNLNECENIYIGNPYKFLIDYFNNVRHKDINPVVIHSLIDAERLKKRYKYCKVPSTSEVIRDMFKYTALSIFSEFYYYWVKFKYNAKRLSYDNPTMVTLTISDEDKEEYFKDKQISLYIQDKLDRIKLNRNNS